MNVKLLFTPVIALTLFAQTPAPEPPVNRANSRLVEINVVVCDKNGPVRGLTQADFTLLDKGKEQKIGSFLASAPAPIPPPAPPNIFSNRPDPKVATTGLTVILLDSLNTPVQAQAYARQEFIQVVSAIKPADRVEVYLLGSKLRVLHDVNPEQLEDVLTNNSVAGGLNIENQLRNTTDALVAISNHIGHFPGRKSLVWVAGAYPVSVDHYGAEGPPGWEDLRVQQTSARQGGINRPTEDPAQLDRQIFHKTFSAAMEALNLANVAVYEVDARGLVDIPASMTVSGTGGSRSRSLATAPGGTLVPAGANALRVLAEDTGGRVFENSNDIQKSIRTAISDSEVSYTIGYFPDSKSLDSRFHDLKVQVSRKDTELHYRKGYLALPEPKITEAQRTETIKQALVSPLEIDAIGLLAGYEQVTQPKPALRVTVVISAADLALQQNANQWTGELDIVLTPRGADGKDRGTTRQVIALKLDTAQHDSVLQQGISLNKTLEPSGEVNELRAVICDRNSGRVGSLIMPIK